jgi:L-alanine-DL-glutamate epimerase-like enolase superfamily enzyme
VRISSFKITRVQVARDRVIEASQLCADEANLAAIELIDAHGRNGLGFAQSLFAPLPGLSEITRAFEAEVWPGLEGQIPLALVQRVTRPRGGNQRPFSLPFHEALQVALWDLAAKQQELPLGTLLGAKRTKVRAYHLSDNDFAEFFGHADCIGYNAFKIKLGNPDFAWDMHRLNLLCCAVGPEALVMIDAKEALVKTKAMHSAGFKLLWVEGPILRTDFEGSRLLRHLTPWTLINSGEAPDPFGGQSGVTDLAIAAKDPAWAK